MTNNLLLGLIWTYLCQNVEVLSKNIPQRLEAEGIQGKTVSPARLKPDKTVRLGKSNNCL